MRLHFKAWDLCLFPDLKALVPSHHILIKCEVRRAWPPISPWFGSWLLLHPPFLPLVPLLTEFQPCWSPLVLQTQKAQSCFGAFGLTDPFVGHTSFEIPDHMSPPQWGSFWPRVKFLSLPLGCWISLTPTYTTWHTGAWLFIASSTSTPHWQAKPRKTFVLLIVVSAASRMGPDTINICWMDEWINNWVIWPYKHSRIFFFLHKLEHMLCYIFWG